jgi:hypothetical protein
LVQRVRVVDNDPVTLGRRRTLVGLTAGSVTGAAAAALLISQGSTRTAEIVTILGTVFAIAFGVVGLWPHAPDSRFGTSWDSGSGAACSLTRVA